jgi:acetyl-CoA C-acetyltransferase
MTSSTAHPEPLLIGFGHTRFGRLDGCSLESLLRDAAALALHDAGLGADDIDMVIVSNYNHGFVPQGFAAGLAALVDEGLRYKPSFHVESACASGSAAVHLAAQAIRAGEAGRVLVLGAEQMTHLTSKQAGDILLSASYVADREAEVDGGFAGAFARIAAAYAARYGDPAQACAMIASKNHRNGLANPDAQLRREYDVDFCATVSPQNPLVAGTIRRTDCSPVSDGAAAIVVAAADRVPRATPAVRMRARAHVTDLMPVGRRDMSELEGCRRAWAQALDKAGMTLADLDLVETHDCFTIAELMQYEAMGLTPPGQGARALHEGHVMRGGALPVNLSGGLKSKGHPIGATGVSMHVMAARQLLGKAGEMQLPGASVAGVFNMGGMGVSNYVSILERAQ